MLVVAATSLNVQATTNSVPVSRTVAVSIQNLEAETSVFIGGSYSVNGIQSATLGGFGSNGSLTITFRAPNSLAPGTYQDTVTVRACRESPCVNHIAGSPVTIAVTYTVTVPPPTVVTFTNTSVAVQASNLGSNPSVENPVIKFAISNPLPGMGARFNVAGGGAVVAYPVINWDAQELQLYMRPPSSMGAGTYTDSVTIEFCQNGGSCSQQLQGSPVTVAVTYVVTGSPNPTVTLNWTQSAITGADMIDSDARSPRMTLTLIPSEPVQNGIFVRHTVSTTGLITDVVEISYAHGSHTDRTLGKYDLILKSPAVLGSGSFTDTMEFEACFDVACTNPVPNGKYTVSLNVVIAAARMRRRTVTGILGATDLVWSQADRSLYIIGKCGLDNCVHRVDPLTLATSASPVLETGALGASIRLNGLAVTEDASYLYVGSKDNPVVYRLQLPSLTPDLSIPLGSSGSQTNVVNDFATVPGYPQSIVVAKAASNRHQGVFVYDNATARPDFVPNNPAQALERPRWLVPAATGGTFITQSYGPSVPKVNNLEQVTIGTTGISTTSSSPTGHEFAFQKPVRSGTKLFTLDGRILDVTNGTVIGNILGSKAIVVDEARERLYLWTVLNQKDVVMSYDLATLDVLGYEPVYDLSVSTGTSGRMVPWGDEGVALVDPVHGRITLLSGTFFTN